MERPVMDRFDLIRAFEKAIAGDLPRVFNFSGVAGCGKSRLLIHFNDMCTKQSIPIAYIRDISGQYPIDILAKIHFSLRNNINFKKYEKACTNVQKRSSIITLEHINMENSNISGISTENQKFDGVIWNDLTNAIFKDIETKCKTTPIVILIDHCEKAERDVKRWLTGVFTEQACKIDNLILVISGQEHYDLFKPGDNVVQHFELKGLEFRDWLTYAEEVGALKHLSENTLEKYHAKANGLPYFLSIHCDGLEE